MRIRSIINLSKLAEIEETKTKELCSLEKLKIIGGGCTCGGTDCGTHGARDGLKDAGIPDPDPSTNG